MRSQTVTLIAAVLALVLLAPPVAAAPTVELQTADSFAVLAGSAITNTGTTTIVGDVGSYPTPAQSGFGPGADSVVLAGTNHHGDNVTSGAKDDLADAYEDAATRTGAVPVVGGELGNLVLTPGVYADDNAPDSLAITGTLTLDGQGDPDSIFIFQSGSSLVTASASNVVLTNGTQACNVFWQVTSSATLGTGSHLEGSILALTSITLDTGASIDGRALARNGAVTMQSNVIRIQPCNEPGPSSTSPATSGSTSMPIPTFPTPLALLVGGVLGIGGAMMVLRRGRK